MCFCNPGLSCASGLLLRAMFTVCVRARSTPRRKYSTPAVLSTVAHSSGLDKWKKPRKLMAHAAFWSIVLVFESEFEAITVLVFTALQGVLVVEFDAFSGGHLLETRLTQTHRLHSNLQTNLLDGPVVTED